MFFLAFPVAFLTAFLSLLILTNAAEHSREIEKQAQKPVYPKAQRICHPQKETAEYPVPPLAEAEEKSLKPFQKAGGTIVKPDLNLQPADTVLPMPLLLQCMHKSGKHVIIGEGNARFHPQFLRLTVTSHLKCGEPPVVFVEMGNLCIPPEKPDGHWHHLMVLYAVKQCGFSPQDGHKALCLINPHFASHVNSILAFPEFNHPCALFIVKIHRHTVNGHIKLGGVAVKQRRITKHPLGRIHRGGKYVLGWVVTVAKRFNQRTEYLTFFLH
jgi:hypothetical protein